LIYFIFKVKPTIITPPQRQIQINAGQTLTIQCTARGSPAPYINWRLNWGHICGDGYDNGRCSIAQSLNNNDPTLVTGTLTILNVNRNDAGAYSCEALNNQGFIFAIPDAIVNVIIGLYFVFKRKRFCIEMIFFFLNRSSSSNSSM
jgi:dystroglycan 1